MNPITTQEGQRYYDDLIVAVCRTAIMMAVMNIVSTHVLNNQKLIGHWSCCNCIECKQRRKKTGQ